mgnify:CR=1 FL=1
MKQFYAIVDGKPAQQSGLEPAWCSEAYEIPEGEDFEWCYVENKELKIDQVKKAKVIQERADKEDKKDKKRVDRAARRAELDVIDWAEVKTIAELKKIVKHLVNELNDKD